MSFQYLDSDVLVWQHGGTERVNAYFGQGEPVFLVAMFGSMVTSAGSPSVRDVLVVLESPQGGRTAVDPISPLDRLMFTLKDVSDDDPISWRLQDDAPHYRIGWAPERLHVFMRTGAEFFKWKLEVHAVPVRLTSMGRVAFPGSAGVFNGR